MNPIILTCICVFTACISILIIYFVVVLVELRGILKDLHFITHELSDRIYKINKTIDLASDLVEKIFVSFKDFREKNGKLFLIFSCLFDIFNIVKRKNVGAKD